MILANTGDWTLADGVWSAAITGDGAAILTALNGAASGVFKGEFTFTDENGGPTSSQTLAATIYNDVWKGTEGTPLSQPTPDAYVAARALLFDRVQSLTDPQKAQAQANIGIPFSNYAATTAPGASNDNTEGYSIGSPWFDTVSKEGYRCVNAATGAAEWVESTFDTAEVAALIAAQAVVTQAALDLKADADSDSTISVQRGTTDVLSAAALRTAYTAAKALTPGGNALSATNRAVVMIPAGRYDFGLGDVADDNHGLELDAEFVDLVGMTGKPEGSCPNLSNRRCFTRHG